MRQKQLTIANRMSGELTFLHAGTPINIDIMTPAGQKGRFRTTFIGYLPKKYILIQFPDANKLGNFAQYIGQGSAITVRGLIEGHEAAVVAFIATVKQTLQIPSRIMVLDFPQNISVQLLRTTKRIRTELLVNVKINNTLWQALITDISPTGCHIEIGNSAGVLVHEGEDVDIIIEDYPEIGSVKLAATICNAKPLSDGVEFGCKLSKGQDSVFEPVIRYALLTGE